MATAKHIREFHIDLFYDEEAGVYGATSEGIPGLFLEAETVGGIMDALVEYAPELIEHNLKIPLDSGRFRFVVGSAEVIPAEGAGKQKTPAGKIPRPQMEVSFPRMEDYIPAAMA